MSDVTDELDDSPILEEVLGDALGKLRVFHAKLAEEGEPRGLIGPRDVGIIWERYWQRRRFSRYRCSCMPAGSPVHSRGAYGTAYRMAERVRDGHGAGERYGGACQS